MHVVHQSTMRALDAAEIAAGTPSLELMERAGAGIAQSLLARPAFLEGTTLVFCGRGNNGGDGLVVARRLREAGHEVVVLTPRGQRSVDSVTNLERARAAEVEVVEVDAPDLARLRSTLQAECAARPGRLVVDALLGSGFTPPLRDDTAVWCEVMGELGRDVAAIDGPTGIGDGAATAPQTPWARWTFALGAPKWSMLSAAARARCGRIEVVDLGFTPAVVAPVLAAAEGCAEWIDAAWVSDRLEPVRVDAHKYSRGTVGVIGASSGMSGAVTLACHGALRAGAGLVEALVPRSQRIAVDAQCVETLVREGDEDSHLGLADLDAARRLLADREALVVGPGAGRNEETLSLVHEVLDAARAQTGAALVIDADGLFALAGGTRPLAPRCVLTPHTGELRRLLGVSAKDILEDRPRWVREAAQRFDAVVLHKGSPTFVADGAGRLAVVGSGGPGLATAGSGDVLAGVLGALLAAGMDAWTAAGAGAWIHGSAGDRGEQLRGTRGLIASDLPPLVASVLRDLEALPR